MQTETWIGPVTIRDLLDQAANVDAIRPPESNSAYVLSLKKWAGRPSTNAGVLYVGSNTGRSKRFRTRIGDLIADLFGFYGSETGHHSGGQSLHRFCLENRVSPSGLYIGWLAEADCVRCTETALFRDLQPRLNKVNPSSCNVHKPSQPE